MSRIGKKPIKLPQGVTATVADGNVVTVKGPKGELTQSFSANYTIEEKDGELIISRPSDDQDIKMLHGTTRALMHNMVTGVSTGFKKELVIVGTGYRASVAGNKLTLIVGYSHDVVLEAPEGIKVECPTATAISVIGIDKEKVGQFAANIRAVRLPEPYQGKGIRYNGEHVRRKVGKKTK